MLSGHDPTRTKRSLLPFVGNVMSSLFGTATYSQLRDPKQHFQQMRHIQSKVIHVVKESVSILNTTHHDVVTNRKLIHKLQNVTKYYCHQINSLINVVKHPKFDPFKVFTKLAIRSHDISKILNFHCIVVVHTELCCVYYSASGYSRSRQQNVGVSRSPIPNTTLLQMHYLGSLMRLI